MDVLRQSGCRTGRFTSNFKVLSFVLMVIMLTTLYSQGSFSVMIESFKENNRIHLLSPQQLEPGEYDVFFKNREMGSITVLSSERIERFDRFRFSILADTGNLERHSSIVSGTNIVLNRRTDDALPDYRDAFGRDEVQYKERVAGAVDGRSMVFVRGGVTLIGSDVGGKDETPLHTQIVDSFYIDVYEVTNRDYLVYVMEGGGSTPRAWKSGAFPAGKADHPVMVTYYEASGYARWAGKRLPTEFEWERPRTASLPPGRRLRMTAWSRIRTRQGIRGEMISRSRQIIPHYGMTPKR